MPSMSDCALSAAVRASSILLFVSSGAGVQSVALLPRSNFMSVMYTSFALFRGPSISLNVAFVASSALVNVLEYRFGAVPSV